MIAPAQVIDAVTHYISANAPRIRGEEAVMPWNQLRTAVAFHALQGTLRVEWSSTVNSEPSTLNPQPSTLTLSPTGVAIVWQTHRAELEAREREGKPAFCWQATNPTGDCLYLNLVITTAPGVMPRLAAWFRQQFPPLPEFAHRRGKLVQFQWLNRLSEKMKDESKSMKLTPVADLQPSTFNLQPLH